MVGRFVATSGEKRWPPVGNFVAASGENSMAIDMQRLQTDMRTSDGHRRARTSVARLAQPACARDHGSAVHGAVPDAAVRRTVRPGGACASCEARHHLRRSSVETVGNTRFPSAACTSSGVRRDGSTALLSCGENVSAPHIGPALVVARSLHLGAWLDSRLHRRIESAGGVGASRLRPSCKQLSRDSASVLADFARAASS